MKRRNFFATLFGGVAAIPLLGKDLAAPERLMGFTVKETIGASVYNPNALKKLTFGVDPGRPWSDSTAITIYEITPTSSNFISGCEFRLIGTKEVGGLG